MAGSFTLIVCTVLTGILEMAMLEKMCPPTWKHPMGNVSRRMAFVGGRSRLNRTTGLINTRQNAATKPNWTKVRVMG